MFAGRFEDNCEKTTMNHCTQEKQQPEATNVEQADDESGAVSGEVLTMSISNFVWNKDGMSIAVLCFRMPCSCNL